MSWQRFEPIQSRREFLSRTGLGFGAAALAHLFHAYAIAAAAGEAQDAGGLPGVPRFPAKAKRVICLFQSGGPSQLDLFDPKWVLNERFNEDLPDSVCKGQRITGMVASQKRLVLQPREFAFQRGGTCGMEISDLLPFTREIADEICVVRSMHTEAINHDPAITFFQSGSQLPGRPTMGAWVDYRLGRLNENLPAFVVLVSVNPKGPGQGLRSRLWGNGFLPSAHQGVRFRSSGEPVLYLNDVPGITRERRRLTLDGIAELNRLQLADVGDPEIETRISQFEMAYRMQASVPGFMVSQPFHPFSSRVIHAKWL